MCLSRRPDGTLVILFGTNDGSGDLMRLDSSLTFDEPANAIDSFYRTAYGGGSSGRNTFQYATASVLGSGTLSVAAIGPDQNTLVQLNNRGLRQSPNYDVEWSGLRVNAERVAWQFGTSGLGDWFKMRKFVPYLRPQPWLRTRGNAP
jgi:hypothetical protein